MKSHITDVELDLARKFHSGTATGFFRFLKNFNITDKKTEIIAFAAATFGSRLPAITFPRSASFLTTTEDIISSNESCFRMTGQRYFQPVWNIDISLSETMPDSVEQDVIYITTLPGPKTIVLDKPAYILTGTLLQATIDNTCKDEISLQFNEDDISFSLCKHYLYAVMKYPEISISIPSQSDNLDEILKLLTLKTRLENRLKTTDKSSTAIAEELKTATQQIGILLAGNTGLNNMMRLSQNQPNKL